MDHRDRDSKITKLEYIEFILLQMQKVDRGLIDELHRQFDHLDQDDTGTIEMKDLELAFRRRKEVVEAVKSLAEKNRAAGGRSKQPRVHAYTPGGEEFGLASK